MIRSLRFRLLVHTSLAAVVVLGVLGTALFYFIQRYANADYNQQLMTEARAVAATAEVQDNKVIFDYSPDEFPKFSTADHPDYFQAWIDPDVVIRSPSLSANSLPRPARNGPTMFRDFVLPDGRPGRLLSMSFTTTIESHAEANSEDADESRLCLMTVASDTVRLHETLSHFFWLLTSLCGVAVVLSGAILFWIVGRGVRPVEALAAGIDRLGENDLSVRLRAPNVPTELRPVVDKLNALLQRLDDAFSREKAFTADVAHELRSPLAAILTTFDVCRSRQRDEGGYVAAIDKCREVARQMQTMVETLLTLARADAGQLTISRKTVEFAELLEECWALFQPRAEAKNLNIQWNVPESISIESDSEKLRIILHNVFDNAVSYANDGGTIRVVAEMRQDRLFVEIANTGSKIPPGKTQNLFDRFRRGDESRSQTGLHCGLGLSLCQRLSKLLHGGIEIESAPESWFIVHLWLATSAGEVNAPNQSEQTKPVISASRQEHEAKSLPPTQTLEAASRGS